MAFGADEAFDRVRDRVVARRRGHRRGLRQGELRVEDDRTKRRFRIATRHFLVRARIGNERVGLRFASRSGGRRHANHRQHRLRGLSVAMKIMNGAALREHEVDPFRTIEGAAAAKPDDRIDATIRRVTPARLEHLGVGIRAELTEVKGARHRRTRATGMRDRGDRLSPDRGPPRRAYA